VVKKKEEETKKRKQSKEMCANAIRSKANESEKLVSKQLYIKKDHLDKSRICALLGSKPLNPRKNQ